MTDLAQLVDDGLEAIAWREAQANAAAPAPRPWYIDAADLLAEPDPGPTPWLIEDLIVDQALVAAVGRWKTTKSYGLLDACISIATGRPLFGKYAVPSPGPVVFVNEESGRAALWRRLDALCRGRAVDPEELRTRLLLAPNARVKLDDGHWQNELVDLGTEIRPRAYLFDPLARMKAANREENAQTEMAVVLEFLRHLRDETGATIIFVHHTGHTGGHMRGSSDLESIWETRLTWIRDGQSPTVTIESEHREAEASDPIDYEIKWHGETRTMRFELPPELNLPTLEDRIAEYLEEHHHGSTDEIRRALETRRSDVKRTLESMQTSGRATSGPSGRRDKAGRPIRDKVWKLNIQAELWPVPTAGQPTQDDEHGQRGSVARPVPLRDGRRDEPPDDPPENGPDWIDELVDTTPPDDDWSAT